MKLSIGDVLAHVGGEAESAPAEGQRVRFLAPDPSGTRDRCLFEVFWEEGRGLVVTSPEGGRLAVWPEVANTVVLRSER